MSADRLMVLGTGSGVGKSVITAGLGRLYHREGRRVVPFKAQNMSNNSRVAAEGGEIAASQAYQARACGVAPSVDFNPLLLKPTGEERSELLVHGEPEGRVNWTEYRRHHGTCREHVMASFTRLESEYDLVLMEGAGSPAEPNLLSHDLVNLPLARAVDAPAILVGDISAGGVFAWLTGTLELLPPKYRERIAGFVINKFRGSRDLLDGAIEDLEARTGRPVLGVLPHRGELPLPAEDSMQLDRLQVDARRPDALRVQVIGFPHVSNFTDLEPVAARPDVSMRVIERPPSGRSPDLVVLPGTRNTLADLAWLKRTGLADYLRDLRTEDTAFLGLCGGYQMMGRSVRDPDGVESDRGGADGLGWFDFRVRFRRPKVVRRVRAERVGDGTGVRGYEIRYGRFEGGSAGTTWLCTREGSVPVGRRRDGIRGTTVHGLFDRPGFRRAYLDDLRARAGLEPIDLPGHEEDPYEAWADVLQRHLDVERITELAGGDTPARASLRP